MALPVPLLTAMLAMTAIVAFRYAAVSGAFAWLTERRAPGLYAGRGGQIRKEIGWSLASAAIYGLPAGLLAWGWQARGWTRIYSNASDYPLWWLPASVLLYLLLHDTWFYWTHRWMHRPRPFKIAHAVHHASRPPTAWAAMSFHPVEALTGAVVIPGLVLFIPIHYGALLVVLSVMTVMGVTNHMGWEMFPDRLVRGPAGKWLITASHHERHHRAYRCNYGLYFRFWDRLCGTDDGLGTFAAHPRAGGAAAGADAERGGGAERGGTRHRADAA
ncbi:sterol desaturase family protein [Sphingosinicella sp. BN140058]|uniref:sterol desaturase family protein n=1 Tax=Sphingosinicella sp. BN140058 TaxID=1892855 RepID=UPI00101336A0|nr:sterol desaturase family protein [Sphingosinicella sp. BN140058]QAY76694.1 fatty acid hydroxylase family protein [Sphingosinicella sp. BN140058]